MSLQYDMPLFRPPSEAYSLILQVTTGCSWNKCSFCEMYSSKNFKVKSFEILESEIRYIVSQGHIIQKVFLADGDAMVLSYNKLVRILDLLNDNFPALRRISAYARPSDILSKSDQELADLNSKGLQLLYIGLETGSDLVLNKINKGETQESSIQALLKAKKAGIKSSVMILNGLGGKEHSQEHALESAKMINQIQPEFLSTLVLSFPYGKEHYEKRLNTDFTELDLTELLEETKQFISQLDLDQTVFRSDHASNYLVLKGTLGKEKARILDQINHALEFPNQSNLRDEWQRGL